MKLSSYIIILLSLFKLCSAQVVLTGNPDSIANKLLEETAPMSVYFNPRISSVKDFINEIQIKENDFNEISVLDDFPTDWIKKEEVNDLVELLNSKVDCKNLKNPLSSLTSNKTVQLGDYAYWLIASYRQKTKLTIGLNYTPSHRSKAEKEELKIWWKKINKTKTRSIHSHLYHKPLHLNLFAYIVCHESSIPRKLD